VNKRLSLRDISNTHTSTIATVSSNTEITTPAGSLLINVGSNVIRGLQIRRSGNTVWDLGGSGDIKSSTSGAGTSASIYAGADGALGFYSVGTTLPLPAIKAIRIDNNNYGIKLIYKNASVSTDGIILRSNGNVQINQPTDAGFRLDVNGTARVQGVLRVGGNINQTGLGFLSVSIGPSASISLNSAYYVAIGNQAGAASSTGSYWTSLGGLSGRVNTTGNYWTSIGFQSGESNISGGSWTAIGSISGNKNTSGSNWISIGHQSARFYSNGVDDATSFSNGVYIGTGTRVGIAGATNEIVIGHNAIGLGSNTTVIGNSSTTFGRWFGNLLVGTSTNAGFRLDVNGTARVQGALTVNGVPTINATSSPALILNRTNNNSNATIQLTTLDASNSTFFGRGNSTNSFFAVGLTNALTTNLFSVASSGSVLINTTVDIVSSILTLESTTRGFLPPRMTSTQRDAISSPAAGLVIYNTTTNLLNVYNGTMWI
jgi:hypothetical protein